MIIANITTINTFQKISLTRNIMTLCQANSEQPTNIKSKYAKVHINGYVITASVEESLVHVSCFLTKLSFADYSEITKYLRHFSLKYSCHDQKGAYYFVLCIRMLFHFTVFIQIPRPETSHIS